MTKRGFTLIDLIVVFVCLAVLGTMLSAARREFAGGSARTYCASNLKQIGFAVVLYQHDFKHFPAAARDADAPVSLFTGFKDDEHASRPNDVTAAMILLIRTQDIEPNVFHCPMTEVDRIEKAQLVQQPNFRGLNQLTYSFINPYRGPRTPESIDLMSDNEAFAIAADLAPPPEESMSATLRSAREGSRRGNSPNHAGHGQNVLFGDLRVEYVETPFVGVDLDHIYTFGPSGRDHPDSPGEGVHGFSTSNSDSILLPTASDGLIPLRVRKHDPWAPTPWQVHGPMVVLGLAGLVVLLPIAYLLQRWVRRRAT